MTILGIYGSPREGGNTDILLNKFLAGCVEAGADIHRICLREVNFRPCTECGACSGTGGCVIDDGLKDAYSSLRESEGVVLASPVFFYGVTAQAKAFIDRMQPFWAEKYLLGKDKVGRKRKGFFISVGATSGERLFEGALLTVKYFYDALGAEYSGDILYRGVEGKGDIVRVDGALGRAFERGKWFAGLIAGSPIGNK